MYILNLVEIDSSEIKYKILRFPDGQQNIVLNTSIKGKDLDKTTDVEIISRLNNFKDLELIIAATACLREMGVKNIFLVVLYFMGARSDRKFEEGGNNYLKHVICPIINSLNFEKVIVLDPHSYVLEACLNNFQKHDNQLVVEFALYEIYGINKLFHEKAILVSPDAGASHKIYKLAENINYKGNIITCSKERDSEGKLTKTVVPIEQNVRGDMGDNLHKDIIIIDDICDGGRTFINIVKAIRNRYILNGFDKKEFPKMYLIVTHGIFSNGFKELNEYFDGIYCTNSYSNIGDKAMINGELQVTNVKQLNLFL